MLLSELTSPSVIAVVASMALQPLALALLIAPLITYGYEDILASPSSGLPEVKALIASEAEGGRGVDPIRVALSRFHGRLAIIYHIHFLLLVLLYSIIMFRPLSFKYIAIDSYMVGSLRRAIFYRVSVALLVSALVTVLVSISSAAIIAGVSGGAGFTGILGVLAPSMLLLIPPAIALSLGAIAVTRDYVVLAVMGTFYSWLALVYGAASPLYESPLTTINLVVGEVSGEDFNTSLYIGLTMVPLVMGLASVSRYDV